MAFSVMGWKGAQEQGLPTDGLRRARPANSIPDHHNQSVTEATNTLVGCCMYVSQRKREGSKGIAQDSTLPQEELAARRSWQPGGARSSQEQTAAKPATRLSERSERILKKKSSQTEDLTCINGGASTAYPK
ncbi:hypothetical protein HaLaN_31754 [Haematococcus lacustris]|uniref:Uncharacterized protein n=1 Tax=Haematococcus lacustris TaxID=44745 RepID=A0A6A0AHU7_HAELA|nr:hypothetical protein HaLaN_31754 [Haematococcus lacustris]